jgi:hypothetical protein
LVHKPGHVISFFCLCHSIFRSSYSALVHKLGHVISFFYLCYSIFRSFNSALVHKLGHVIFPVFVIQYSVPFILHWFTNLDMSATI